MYDKNLHIFYKSSYLLNFLWSRLKKSKWGMSKCYHRNIIYKYNVMYIKPFCIPFFNFFAFNFFFKSAGKTRKYLKCPVIFFILSQVWTCGYLFRPVNYQITGPLHQWILFYFKHSAFYLFLKKYSGQSNKTWEDKYFTSGSRYM